ncbi:MAG: hypothetical protein KBT14_01655, partial [Proteobacteria bacterium]|nr:hypothetical protein [Candidatus Enterousia onthequi]
KVSQKNLGFWYTVCKGKNLRKSKEKSKYRESKKMHKKTSFLRDFQKNRLFACVFCVFFASSALASLPAGFTELEYIESTGTQWIDTGVNFDTTNIGFKTISDNTATQPHIGSGTANYIIGTYGNGYAGAFIRTSNGTNNTIVFGNSGTGATNEKSVSSVVSQEDIIEYNYKNSRKKLFNNIDTNYDIASHDYNGSLLLFSVQKNNVYTSAIKMYTCEITDGNTIIRNFIPAKRDSDDEIGMYDKAWDGSQYGVVDLGTLNWNKESTNGFFTSWDLRNIKKTGQLNLWNSFYITPVSEGSPLLIPNKHIIGHGVADVFYIRDDEAYASMSASEFKQAMSGVKLYYQRTTDTEFHGPFYTNAGTGTFVAGPEKSISDIQIATTKFVDDEFKAAEDQLATTVQTIESVVSRTIAQTGQIQVLQDTKQTRPDESCPANMKCLLVQDEDGTPHWYPIIEP